MDYKRFWAIANVDEHYKFQEFLEKIRSDREKRVKFYDDLQKEINSDEDIFREYFEEYASERKNNQQDFTPESLCELCREILNVQNVIVDFCAGTGALLISGWKKNKEVNMIAYEKSNSAFNCLLHNIAIKNIEAILINGDSLTGEVKEAYELIKGEKYSEIIKKDIGKAPCFQCGSIIMNPPYSAKWDAEKFKNDERFKMGLAPKSKADYAFILNALNHLDANGEAVFILPHGILFRGGNEGKIRKALLNDNLIDAVIGMPANLFFNTSIPVCVVKFKKNKQNNDVLFIDASKEFEKQKSQNIMRKDHIQKILDTYKKRENVEKFAYVSTLEEIKENDYNLNIPRYVDTFEEEEEIDIKEVMKEIEELEAKRDRLDQEINIYLKELGVLGD